jgi:hypothetical protein
MAVFCPRLPGESEGARHQREQACRQYLREVRQVEALVFDTLEHLQVNYRKQAFRRVLVAQSGYYPPAFWQWTSQERIDVLDVMLRPEQAPAKEKNVYTPRVSNRFTAWSVRRETRPS